ncbi:MULE transposase [Hirsutella rhossiliensis]
MDNTYLVNRFNMPLLQIIGTTGLHKSYSVAFGIASKEDEGAFNWILSHLYDTGRRASIPAPGVQQLCVWHMMKNVILHIKKKWVGSLEGTEIIGDRADEADTRLGAAAALANDRTNANAIEDRPIDHTAEAQIQHASQLADQYLDEERDDEGNPIPPPPPKRTFKHTADGIRDAWASVVRARTPEECSEQWNLLCVEFFDQPALVNYLRTTYYPWRAQFCRLLKFPSILLIPTGYYTVLLLNYDGISNHDMSPIPMLSSLAGVRTTGPRQPLHWRHPRAGSLAHHDGFMWAQPPAQSHGTVREHFQQPGDQTDTAPCNSSERAVPKFVPYVPRPPPRRTDPSSQSQSQSQR